MTGSALEVHGSNAPVCASTKLALVLPHGPSCPRSGLCSVRSKCQPTQPSKASSTPDGEKINKQSLLHLSDFGRLPSLTFVLSLPPLHPLGQACCLPTPDSSNNTLRLLHPLGFGAVRDTDSTPQQLRLYCRLCLHRLFLALHPFAGFQLPKSLSSQRFQRRTDLQPALVTSFDLAIGDRS